MKTFHIGQSRDTNTGDVLTHLYDSAETGAWLKDNQPVADREFSYPLCLECPDDFDVTSIGGLDSADPQTLATLAELFGFDPDDFDSPEQIEAEAEQIQVPNEQA